MVGPGGRCADTNNRRVGERRANHDGQSSGAMTTQLAASSITAAMNAPLLRSSATVLWPGARKFGDNQGRMCGMSVLRRRYDSNYLLLEHRLDNPACRNAPDRNGRRWTVDVPL